MTLKYDTLILGAGPAGIYLGLTLAKKGVSVIILEQESREKVGLKMDQFHMDAYTFEEFDIIPPPTPGTDEYITKFDITNHYSPTGKIIQKMNWPVIAMRFPFFIQRLIKIAERDGVRLEFSSRFKNGIYDKKKLVGIVVDKNNEEYEYFGRIIVDASGTNAILRRSLPDDYGVETFNIEDNEKMYVIQRVIRWLKPDETHPGTDSKSNTWMYYKNWIAPHFKPNANIFGNGQPGGFKNAEKANKIFLENISFPPYDILEEHRAKTVYRRSPYSLVGDGFFCIGDSACMTKPFNGEGISLSWTVANIATEIFIEALKSPEYISKNKLWDINVRYYKDIGAKLAALLAQIPVAANTSKKEMEYLFKKGVIFSGRDFEDMNKFNELRIGLGRFIKMVLIFLWGLLTRQFSRKTISSMLKYMKISNKIRKKYEKFPENINEFNEWVQSTEELWSPVEKMKFSLNN
ncbi:MAG: NAD(P)/FAD-dependent oxidoreductase [Promethearchaeota archaeon]|nr:MAG: NAD(P)/FAD-dependent oxidoreductase [Candidatus Lokiarchaeota archaeon]